jgi:hypothetical protein
MTTMGAYVQGGVPEGGTFDADNKAVVRPYVDALEEPSVELVFVVEIDVRVLVDTAS